MATEDKWKANFEKVAFTKHILWKKQIRKDFKERSAGWGFSEGLLVDGHKLVCSRAATKRLLWLSTS